ncbi:Sensory/regulatory protein RpfC [compost metagenome]
MRQHGFMVLCSLGLVFIIPVYMIISLIYSSPMKPEAHKGILDLSAWNFQTEGKVELIGEWEFYRNQLLEPGDFQRSQASDSSPRLSVITRIPGEWNSYISADGTPASFGYGTYRLQVRLKDHPGKGVYGIQTTNIRMANRIFINGEEVGGSGVPSVSADTGTSGNIPYTSFIPLSGEHAEILVQVANYSYSSGGMLTPIIFGDGASISRSYQTNMLEDLITALSFLLFSLHFFYVFRVRKHEYASLFLGGFCLSGLIYVLTHGQKLIGVIMPGMSYEIILKIQLISSTLVYFFLIRYVAASIPQVISRKVLIFSDVLSAAQLTAGILLPARIFSMWDIAIFAYGFISVLYVFYVLLKGIRLYPGHRVLMLTGGMSILAIIILKLLNVVGILMIDALTIYEILIFVMVQTLLMSKRFTDSYLEVEALSNRLLTLDGLKDEFMANTSHELRTPLHAIVNITESLIGGVAGPLNRGQAEHLALVASTGKRITLLIEGILEFTRLRAGDLSMDPKPVYLPAAAGSVWEVISLTVGRKDIRFIQTYSDDLPPVYIDENRLQQILFHLLGNAVKYTEHGVVAIMAKAEPDGVTLSVSDTGIGMSPSYVEELMQFFTQGRGRLVNEHTRAGLGLRITWELIKLAGGAIRVESVEGSGTTFHVTLPAAVDTGIMPQNALGEIAAGGDSIRSVHSPASVRQDKELEELGTLEEPWQFTVLIVDDDPVNLKVLNSLLYMENYHVITVDNGQDALEEVLRNPKIDLVILDWMMPGMSGLDLCRQLRERFVLSELPVLMLTARSSPEDIRTGFEAGINDFLSKPVNSMELRVRVRTLLELRRSVQTAVRTEMAFLQAQIKPHFLYNALNTMIALCPVDPDKTMRMLMELSQYLRGSFDFQNRDQFIPLQKELELVESYIYLEKARFEDRLQMEISLEGDLHVMIPPLSIQPLVENAVRHGIMQREAGGLIQLEMKVTKEQVRVTVIDNGVGMTPEKLSSLLSGKAARGGVGLMNIHQRLRALNRSGLSVESEPGQGTTVSFELSRAAMNNLR